MATALLYRPQPPWRISIALVAAVLVHVAALGIAANLTTTVPDYAPVGSGGEVDLLGPVEPPANVQPPEDLPLPTSPNAEPTEFVETPTAPMPHAAHSRVPVTRRMPIGTLTARPTNGGTNSLGTTRVSAISAPRPVYPYEARRLRLIGSGVATLTIDPASGNVSEVTMARSTGNAVLDNAAISGFRRWRFAVGTPTKIQTPITFTLTGASL